ncbi:hypothetical protein [Rhodococcus sp. 15-2388-1-1a]|uniref:hypothetical protein n=1 Tax=Rhodococcus sp. 15-2388-1-1a TaxID=2023142 RepID=UPI0020CF9B2F|nr:hypothetical protein [Rhodococcus sp. 15-2388-1-1a]
MTGASYGLRFLRGLSGIVTAGLVVLAIGVAVTQYLGHSRGFPGPGGVSVAAHIVAAGVAVFAQRSASPITVAVSRLFSGRSWSSSSPASSCGHNGGSRSRGGINLPALDSVVRWGGDVAHWGTDRATAHR